MSALPVFSRISLYLLLVLIGVLVFIIWWAQIGVLNGKPFRNPDGSVDDWHKQKIFYGISLADVFVACPAAFAGIILLFPAPKWGLYTLAIVSFWLVWANTMTTATSLRFEKPKITLMWFLVFPFGAIVGLLYIIWTFVHFNIIYAL